MNEDLQVEMALNRLLPCPETSATSGPKLALVNFEGINFSIYENY